MYPAGWVVVSFILLLLIWLIILSYLFWKERKFLYQLFPKSGQRDIRLKFKELIETVEQFERQNQDLGKSIVGVKRLGLIHIQKIAMLRYNPYNDTGGDQSFSLGFLNGKDDGLLLTSLHSRAGTRIYIKEIKSGKSDLDLSKEEKQVLEQAVNS